MPTIRGRRGLSLKAKIERHRQPGACRDCHAKIDPWGIPFESFDAIGRWRDVVDSDEAATDGAKFIDARSTLATGESIDGIVELKRHLREEQHEQLADAIVLSHVDLRPWSPT